LAALIETLDQETADPNREGETSSKCKWAIKILKSIGNKAAVAALMEAAKRHNGDALCEFARMPGDVGVTALVELSGSPDPRLANPALAVLKVSLHSGTSIEVHYKGLKSPNALLREFAASCLARQSQSKRAQEALLAGLSDPSYAVRVICAEGLGYIGARDAVPALVQAWKVAASDPFVSTEKYTNDVGQHPPLRMMFIVENALEKLAPDEIDRLIEAARQDGSLSKMARVDIDRRRGRKKTKAWW
jgi:hypothetical protein